MAVIDPAAQQLLLAQQQAAQVVPATNPLVPTPAVPQAGQVPFREGLTGVSPLTIPATLTDPSSGLAPDTILGMTIPQFASVAGGIGQALSPPDTWQSRLGSFAKALGQGKIVGGLTGEDVTGANLTPNATKTKKSRLNETDLGAALAGGK